MRRVVLLACLLGGPAFAQEPCEIAPVTDGPEMAVGINANFECLASRIETTLSAELYQTKTGSLSVVLTSAVANQAQKSVIASLAVRGEQTGNSRIMGGVVTDNLGNTLPLQAITGWVRCAPEDCLADADGAWTRLGNRDVMVVTATFASDTLERIGRTGTMTLEAVIEGRTQNTLQGLGVSNFPIENGAR